jgi:hypothetical protein
MITTQDIDRLGSDFGYCGERGMMRSAGPSVDRAVVKAANESCLSEDEFGQWLRSKLGRWYAEDEGYFWKSSRSHNPAAAEKLSKARSSMAQMRKYIAEGSW